MIGLRKHKHCVCCKKPVAEWKESEFVRQLREATENRRSQYGGLACLRSAETIDDKCRRCYVDNLVWAVRENRDECDRLTREVIALQLERDHLSAELEKNAEAPTKKGGGKK